MTAGREADAAEEFIFNTLTGDATLMALLPGGVNNVQAPQGTAYPFVVYQFMSGIDYAAVGANRIWQNLIFLVKVVGETADFGSLGAAVARIDVLLHRASGAAADGTIWGCVREQSIRLPDSVNGKQYRHAGAIFRIYAT